MVALTSTARPGSQGGTGQTTASGATTAAAGAVVPFTRASTLHTESTQYDNTVALGTSGVTMPLTVVPAFGYLRDILLKVTITSTGGTPVFAADGPFNVFSDVTFAEPNGQQIFSLPGGYYAYLANKYGGYRGHNEPKNWTGYTVTGGSATFFLHIPLELEVRDAIGSLPNQNSSANFQLRLSLNTLASIYSSLPTSATVRVQSFMNAWDQPGPDTFGQRNETAPPAMNTTQFWSLTSVPFNAGQNTIRLTRVGNYLRNICLIARNAGGARADALIPQLTTFAYDSQPIDYIDDSVWKLRMTQRYGYTGTLDAPGGLDTGVYNYDFIHDFTGRAGFETRNQWLPTLSSSRVEFSGTFQGAGTLYILTNDVVLAENVFLR